MQHGNIITYLNFRKLYSMKHNSIHLNNFFLKNNRMLITINVKYQNLNYNFRFFRNVHNKNITQTNEWKSNNHIHTLLCLISFSQLVLMVWFMVFNATFPNISFISWRSVLLVEYPEKTTDLPQVTDKFLT